MTYRVLLDVRERHWSQNPYIEQLTLAASPQIQYVGFSWWTAIMGRYDAVHVHWPEFMVRHPNSTVQWITVLLMCLFELRLAVLRVPVVETKHNPKPHEPGGHCEQTLLRALRRSVRANIWLVDDDAVSRFPAIKNVVIPHGPYPVDNSLRRERALWGESQEGPVELLCVGILRPYKGIESLIEAVGGDDRLRLRVFGSADDQDYGASLLALANKYRNVECQIGRVPEGEMQAYVQSARVVVIPYGRLYNSGILFYSLSCGTPVVVLDSERAHQLASEFGSEWVRIISDLTGNDLHVASSVLHPEGVPNFGLRDWSLIGDAHISLFNDLLGRSGWMYR